MGTRGVSPPPVRSRTSPAEHIRHVVRFSEVDNEIGGADNGMGEADNEMGEADNEMGEANDEMDEANNEMGEANNEMGEADNIGEADSEIGEAVEDGCREEMSTTHQLCGSYGKKIGSRSHPSQSPFLVAEEKLKKKVRCLMVLSLHELM